MKRYEEVLRDLEVRDELSDYAEGYIAGLKAYAWMKDGTYYVGTTGTTLAQAVENRLRQLGKWPE
jgi:hypothetical protein